MLKATTRAESDDVWQIRACADEPKSEVASAESGLWHADVEPDGGRDGGEGVTVTGDEWEMFGCCSGPRAYLAMTKP